jgi:hypothetical protein
MPWDSKIITTGLVDLDCGDWDSYSPLLIDCGAWNDNTDTPFYDCGDYRLVGIMDNILQATEKMNHNFLGIYLDLSALQRGALIHKIFDGGDV